MLVLFRLWEAWTYLCIREYGINVVVRHLEGCFVRCTATFGVEAIYAFDPRQETRR